LTIFITSCGVAIIVNLLTHQEAGEAGDNKKANAASLAETVPTPVCEARHFATGWYANQPEI
jgi:hypothetical protein